MSFETLFTPYSVKGCTVPNRFAMAPMQRHKPDNFIPSSDHAEDYRDRVKGGVGMIVTQGTTMDHWTTSSPYARLFPPAYDGWRRCAAAVREEGGQIFLQLWHEGANRDGGYGPSGLNAVGELRGNSLSREAIAEIIDLYAASAQMAQKLGFSGVELHGAHGNLIDQFFYVGSNKRTDEYGGDLAGRMRFGLEVIRAVRDAVGENFPLSMRISQWKANLYTAQPFTTPEELEDFLLPLKEAGIDMLHASARRFWEPEFEGSDLGYAAWVKKLASLPTIAVGSVGLDVDMHTSFAGQLAHNTGQEGVDELVRRFDRGDFDMVAVGRAVLIDPDWVNKLRDRRFEDMRANLTTVEIRGTTVLRNYTLPPKSP